MISETFGTELPGPQPKPRFDDSVSQLIRSAERFMGLRKFAFAEEQLSLAKALDPNNPYIWAIQERLHTLQLAQGKPLAKLMLGTSTASDSERYLSVTVGPGFNSGIRGLNENDGRSQKELQITIRHLTSVAESFLEKGSYENAFDSLMKAYLLDPVSPYVLSCEKVVLPAWNAAHKKANK